MTLVGSDTTTELMSTCSQCDSPGVFFTPEGLLCARHTLARLSEDDPWIPVRRKRKDGLPESLSSRQ